MKNICFTIRNIDYGGAYEISKHFAIGKIVEQWVDLIES